MKSFNKFFNEVLYRSTLIFTLIVFFFSLMHELLGFEGSSTHGIADLILFYLFSFVLSYSFKVFEHKSLKYFSALIIHYIITVFDAIFMFSLLGKKGKVAAVIIIVTVIYILCAAVAGIIRRLIRNSIETSSKEKSKSSYKKQFK